MIEASTAIAGNNTTGGRRIFLSFLLPQEEEAEDISSSH
jgi:hypothetical protein